MVSVRAVRHPAPLLPCGLGFGFRVGVGAYSEQEFDSSLRLLQRRVRLGAHQRVGPAVPLAGVEVVDGTKRPAVVGLELVEATVPDSDPLSAHATRIRTGVCHG